MSSTRGPGCLMIGVIAVCVLVVLVTLLWGTCLSGVFSNAPGATDAEPERLIVATEGARMWWETHLATIEAECEELRRAEREPDADELWSATQREHEDWLALDDIERRRWVTDRIEATE